MLVRGLEREKKREEANQAHFHEGQLAFHLAGSSESQGRAWDSVVLLRGEGAGEFTL